MSTDTNKAIQDNKNDMYDDLSNLNEDKVVLKSFLKSEVYCKETERIDNATSDYENICSYFSEDNDIETPQIDKSTKLFDKNEYDINCNNCNIIEEDNSCRLCKYTANIVENNVSNSIQLQKSSCKRKTKSKRLVKVGKVCRTCKSIKSQYPNGEDIEKATISDEDIRKYNEFMNEKVECDACRRQVSKSEAFMVENSFICNKCAKKERTKLDDLKFDLFDVLDYSGEKLYKCRRLEHARPFYHFIKYSKISKSYLHLRHCCYCRLYKSQEHFLGRNKYKRSLNLKKQNKIL